MGTPDLPDDRAVGEPRRQGAGAPARFEGVDAAHLIQAERPQLVADRIRELL